MQFLGKHRDNNFVKTERRRNYLVSEPNYHTTKFLLAIELKTKKKADTYE